MASVPEKETQKILDDIASAVRRELATWIPVLLAPVVKEIKDLRNTSHPPRQPSVVTSPSARNPRGSAGAVNERYFDTPPGFANGLDVYDNGTAEYEAVPHRQNQAFAPMNGFSQEPGTETTSPLIAHDGLPEDQSTPREPFCHSLWRRLCCCFRGPSARGDYQLTQRYEAMDEPGTDSDKMELEDWQFDDYGREMTDPEAARQLPRRIEELESEVATFRKDLEGLDNLWNNRRFPYQQDIANVCREIEELQEELELARTPKNKGPPPPGPTFLKFVDSEVFSMVCNFVVLLNLVSMIIAPNLKRYAGAFWTLDHAFLAWYVVELSLKATYHHCHLIFGKFSVVWWNWLDLGIVVSGIVDQWVLPLLTAMNGGHSALNVSALRMLRLLRLFRIMRFLRIFKAFLRSDFAWTESTYFELCMAFVIALNAILMSVELDLPWMGWEYVENILQVVYTFELALRIKRQCCRFFIDMDNMVWNYLDFIMVCGGALDLWLVPLIHTLQAAVFGIATTQDKTLSELLKILKIMRILRVLRLVRLLKMVKPLYRLLIGVIASIKAMQWVLVLTLLTLYACSIVFTTLVGKGLITSGNVSHAAYRYFGSVAKSFFSLFKLMNGDLSVVEPITDSAEGQLLFAGFMVVANWAILAILTAVVSDNMITSSQKANEEDEKKHRENEHEHRIRRLTALFREIDTDGEGTVSTQEWCAMLQDRTLQHELCEATGLDEDDLNDYFECLATDRLQEERDRRRASVYRSDWRLDYHTFMEALKHEGVLADRKSILHVMKQLRIVDGQVKREFQEIEKKLMRD